VWRSLNAQTKKDRSLGLPVHPSSTSRFIYANDTHSHTVKKFSCFYGTRSFIIVFTGARHFTLSPMNPAYNVMYHFLRIDFNIVTCRCVCVTYTTGSGLDDWIYCPLYIHNSELQAITALSLIYTLYSLSLHNTLGFSVFTSRILATDL
jgi:hypothetical protein